MYLFLCLYFLYQFFCSYYLDKLYRKYHEQPQVNQRQSYKSVVRGGRPNEGLTPFLISFKVSSKKKIPASILFQLGYRYLWENIIEIGNLIAEDKSISNFTEKSPSCETYLIKFTIQIINKYGPQRFKKKYLAAIKEVKLQIFL